MNSLFDEVIRRKTSKTRYNPRPKIPETGWKRPTGFPDLSHCGAICWDFETYDPNLRESGPGWGKGDGHPVGLAVGTDDGYLAYYPFAHEDEKHDNFPEEQVRRWAADQLRHHNIWSVFWNGGYDAGWLLEWGIKLVGPIWDGWIAEKLLLSSLSNRKSNSGGSLEESAQRRIGKGKKSVELLRWIHQCFGHGPTPADEDLDDSLKAFIHKTPPRLVGPYGESDVALPLEMAGIQTELLEERGLMDLFLMECDLIPLFTQIRFEGVSVDQRASEIADRDTAIEIRNLQKEVDHLAGQSVVVTEKHRIGQILTARGHSVPLTPKTKKYSVKEEFLRSLDDPLVEKLIELGEIQKFHSSFIQGAILKNTVKGRIHCNLKPFGTITGRLSAEKPNLQQIPSKNKRLMETVRSIFIPDTGHSHWEKMDYSQLQMRIFAHFAVGPGSDDLRHEYNRNPKTNYHKFGHSMILEKAGLDLPHKSVKNTGFALIFGAGLPKIARMIGLPKHESEAFFNAYFTGLPYVTPTMEHISQETSQQGHSLTILGRRVEFDLWEGKFQRWDGPRLALPLEEALEKWGPNLQRAFLHKATNYVVQGSEADLIKMALWKCWKDGVFDAIGVPKLLVHDEICESARDDSETTREGFRELRRRMETAIKFQVPILVSRETGPNWGQTKEVDA